ncbi:hypothetical protein CVT25_007075 [Psilocybe cyanescens]|uniref:Uncharacterized protein n=1 Tax=Psilocybe cyanescens TaxID=93625 RepID=A0A409WVE1_PSICY|nr:hypothetical protein CVT25_007075 [Psilocybe cyanescens]
MVVREEATFTDLANPSVSPLLPYFGDLFVTIRAKDKVEVFKPPKKPIEFLLIVNADQWAAADNFDSVRLEVKYVKAQAQSHQSHLSMVQKQKSSTAMKPKSAIIVTNPGSLNVIKTLPVSGKQKRTEIPITVSNSEESGEDEVRALANTKAETSLFVLAPAGNSSTQDSDALLHLDHHEICKAIRHGVNHVLTERIQFHLIIVIPFHNLLMGSGEPYVDLNLSLHGLIACDPRKELPSFLDQGTFKTASRAKLTLLNVASSPGLGIHPNIAEDVALKQFFQPKAKAGVVKRYPAADEKNMILNEAKLMGWAASLLQLAYSFINHYLETVQVSPPFPIPELCFVHAGIAFAQKEIDIAGSNHSSLHASYLLEKLI